MEFCEIARALGVEKYPANLEKYYPVPKGREKELCSMELMERLQQRFGLFGEYFEAVKEGFEDLRRDPVRKAYLDAASLYFKDASLAEVRSLPYPANGETPASRMLPLLAHLSSVENAYDKYRERGFTHDQAVKNLRAYRMYLWEMEKHRAGYVGLTPELSRWVSQFTKAMMFYPGEGGISFQPIAMDPTQSPYYLQKKTTGKLLPVFGHGIMMHKSGIPLGSAGAEDPEGAFTPAFEETEDAYFGNPVRDGLVSSQRERFSKEEWQILIRPGENVLATHIFFGSDFTPEHLDEVLAEGWELGRRCYPEMDLKAQYCRSWLLSPALEEILGGSSKVAMFGNRFVRFPIMSLGKAVLEFVFPGRWESLEALPETTSLQRKIKKKLLDGGQIYVVAGIIPQSKEN